MKLNLYKIVYGHELPCRLTLFTSLLRMNHLSDGDADASPDTKTKVESITFHMSGMAWLPLQGHVTNSIFDSHEKCGVYVMISVAPAGKSVGPLWQKFNVVVFSGTASVINVKLCMMVLLIEPYLFISLSVTLTILQGHRSIKQFSQKMLCSHPIKLRHLRTGEHVK